MDEKWSSKGVEDEMDSEIVDEARWIVYGNCNVRRGSGGIQEKKKSVVVDECEKWEWGSDLRSGFERILLKGLAHCWTIE